MSQFPYPNDPHQSGSLPYAQAYSAPKLRPTSVTVLAIIGIIWGSLLLLGSLMNVLQAAGLSIGGDNPIVKGMQDDPVLFTWTIISVIVNLVMGGLLLGGSIWSLGLKKLGRSWMIVFSWLDVAFTLIGTVVAAAIVYPKMEEIIKNSSNSTPGLAPGTLQTIMEASLWGGLLFSIVALVYPGLILYYMSRPHVKEAFARGLVAPPQQWGAGSPNAPYDPRTQQGGYPPPPGGAGTY